MIGTYRRDCAAILLSVAFLWGCVTGGGGSVGVYADTRRDVGIAVRGHSNMLGFRIADTADNNPAGAPLLGVEVGTAFSFMQDFWHLQIGVPIGAATWDDLNQQHGMRFAPQFLVDMPLDYDGHGRDMAFGGGLAGAYLRHLSVDTDRYDGPDAIRIHRMGPIVSVSVLRDSAGWFASFFLGVMYDFEAYVATGK